MILEVGSCFVRFPGRVFPLGFEDVLPGHPVNLLKLLMSMLQCMSARFGRPRRLSPMQAPASANGPDPQWLRHRFRSPGMHVPDAGVAGLSLAEGMRQCGCVCVCLCVCVTGHFRAAPLYSRPSQIFLHDRCRVAFSDDGCVHGDALFLSLIFAGRLGAASLSSQQSKAVGCCGMFQTQGLTWLSCGRVALSSYLRTEPLLQVTWSVTSPAGQPQPQTPFCILVFFSRV